MLIISYKIVGISGWTQLFNDTTGGQSMPDFDGTTKNLTMVTPGFAAENQAITPMANSVVGISWNFSFAYPTPVAATDAMLALEIALAGKSIHIQLQVGANNAMKTYYYPNCSVDGFKRKIQGSNAMLNLVLKANPITKTMPTT